MASQECAPKWVRKLARRIRHPFYRKSKVTWRQQFAPVTISGLDKVLKETYAPALRAQLNQQSKMMEHILAHQDMVMYGTPRPDFRAIVAARGVEIESLKKRLDNQAEIIHNQKRKIKRLKGRLTK